MMNTFVLFCCILTAGLGIVYGGFTVGSLTWNSVATEFELDGMADVDVAVAKAATKYFRWYINSQKPKALQVDLGKDPTIPGQKVVAIFTLGKVDPSDPIGHLEVYKFFESGKPTDYRQPGCVYNDVPDAEKNLLLRHDKIPEALRNFIRENKFALTYNKINAVTIDYDLVMSGPAGIQCPRICVQVVGVK